MLPLKEVGVQSIVGELRCHMLCGEAKKKEKDIVQNDKDTKGQACSRTNQCAFFFLITKYFFLLSLLLPLSPSSPHPPLMMVENLSLFIISPS